MRTNTSGKKPKYSVQKEGKSVSKNSGKQWKTVVKIV